MPFEPWIPVLISVLAAIPGILAWVGGLRGRQADATASITGAATDMIEALSSRVEDLENDLSVIRKENEKLRKENREYRDENAELWRGLLSLLSQMQEHTIAPRWEPSAIIVRQHTRRSNGD